jgi:superfamily I DNA/RNA helicase
VNNLRLILGGPGCGKTTRLLEIVAEEMTAGVPASAIAFVTFTKAAADEARDRAAALFALDPKDLPWFRTIHSLAYARLGVTRDEVMDRKDWIEFGAVVGEELTGNYDPTDGVVSTSGGRETGDAMLRIVDFAATTMRTLEQSWRDLDEAVDWHRLVRFAEALRFYKEDSDKMDFGDMLRAYIDHGDPVPVRVAVIDEAQDLTAAQWSAVRRAFAGAERVYVGGDDDQAIYQWAGADVAQFLSLSRAPDVLPVSHRLPRAVHTLARSLSARISARYVKRFLPSPEKDGAVEWHQRADAVDFGSGSWFLLARNTYMLGRLEALVRDAGFNYSRRAGPAVLPGDVTVMQAWERLRIGKIPDIEPKTAKQLLKALGMPTMQMRETMRYDLDSLNVDPMLRGLPWSLALIGIPSQRRDYYLACLRRGEKLTKEPRIRIETIHGVKGAEADHVLLMTDLSHRTAKSYRIAPDNEHRVFYVGATRALQSLHVVMPQSDLFYPMD